MMRRLNEEELSVRCVFSSGALRINESVVKLPDERIIKRLWIEHEGSVAVIARRSDGRIAIEDQYRFGIREITHEIPAGHVEKGEDIRTAAERELLEETGCRASELIFLGYMTPTGSTSSEKTAMFFADDVKTVSGQNLDSDEMIAVNWLLPSEVDEMILDGRIWDPKTICALYHAKLRGLI